MDIFEAIILGIIQGLTEFLPVSSSGHLTIFSHLFGLTNGEDNLSFIVTVHAATVLSTIVVLWKEISELFCDFFKFQWNESTKYICKILISMIPIMIIGLFFKNTVEAIFGSGLLIVGICLIITALLLFFAYKAKPQKKENISFKDAFLIGIAQALAVLPGLSRSGTTIATGLLLGNNKESVAKFSFLMVLIPILGEAFLDTLDLVKTGVTSTDFMVLLAGFLSAFITGCIACKWMLNIVKKGKLIYFSIYCLFAAILAIFLHFIL